MSYLSSEFLSSFKGIQPRNKGILFEIVRLRSYSRWLLEKKRRETWLETVQRVVEHSLSLYPTDGPASKEGLIKEAELMFEKIYNLEVFPAGRSLWVAGTEAAKKYPSALWNCAYTDLTCVEDFCELFHLLLCGCGVGFGVQRENIDQLPDFSTHIEVYHKKYNTKYPAKREVTDIYRREEGNSFEIKVGDSKEGWIQALRLFFNLITQHNEIQILFDYDFVRPAGERIHSFGGRAPGPQGLIEMFTNLAEVINKSGGRLSSVDCIDICNFIAKNVIVGGTRRSSQIALGDADDEEFIKAKKDLWVHKENLQRTMSNNSIAFKEKPSLELLKEVFGNIKTNGEPGIWNFEKVKKSAPNRRGTNPCNEICSDSKQFCNLVSINLVAHIENGVLNWKKFKESMEVAVRIGLRHTNITVELPEWDYKQKRDRLLGISLTGIMDALNKLGWDFQDQKTIDLLCSLRKKVHKESKKYASEMRVPKPLLTTCVKPEGTQSQLPTVSSGVHASYAPYFIRRIRVSSIDPVAKALIKCGIPYQIDPGKVERLAFEFPIKTETKKSANEESVFEQFNRYLVMMENYVDHNCSITILANEEEFKEVPELVHTNWDKIIGCAWLPKDTTAYPLMPYEAITEQEYNERQAGIGNLNELEYWTNHYENFNEYERLDSELDSGCSSNQCPVR